ncbi:gluconate 2-dehydrogenase subunit 3 family protein [Oceanobacillus massiliensis]|uniref:gluconate 2-dehydrogenase subunit 3 family protein n=1 Tax=Oceanobacillus massiliensis TaxID=1465765 RepID=UPI0030185771
MPEEKNKVDLSRRKFLRSSGYVAGGVVGGSILGSLLGGNIGTETEQTAPETGQQTEQQNFQQARMFFKRQKDFDVLSAATERIFPEDDNGPGAIQLAVPYFIDHQMASGYGNNEREYMQGPFYPGTDYQGYQTRLRRNEVFLQGVRALDQESQKQFDASFTEIEGDQQDEILTKFQNEEVKMKGVTSNTFFSLLRSATLAGVYSDPMYGGNNNMEGWKMKEYPGSIMSYINEIESEDFVEMDPQSLSNH